MVGQAFGEPAGWPRQDLIGWSEQFDAHIAYEGYYCGVFPMPVDGLEPPAMGWWSPMLRGILPLRGLRVTRSLRKSAKRYLTTVDEDFDGVIAACANPDRDGAWIDSRIHLAYRKLAAEGVAHSVEVWDGAGRLVGGLYGVHAHGVFAGESMFHDPELGRDASKVALIRLVTHLLQMGVTLLDVQWLTEHLGTMGAFEIPREEYLTRLDRALRLPHQPWSTGRWQGAELLARFDAAMAADPLSPYRGAPASDILGGGGGR